MITTKLFQNSEAYITAVDGAVWKVQLDLPPFKKLKQSSKMALGIENIVLMLIVSVLLGIHPSTCNPVENENLVRILKKQFPYNFQILLSVNFSLYLQAALSERLDKLQTKVESLETENVRIFYFSIYSVLDYFNSFGTSQTIFQFCSTLQSSKDSV